MKQKKVLKRALSLLLAITMIAGTITVFGSNNVIAAEENLITNGGFSQVGTWVDQDGTTVPAQEEQEAIDTVYAYQDSFDNGTDTYTYVQGTGSHIVETQGENKVVKITSDTNDWYTLGTTTAGIPVKSGETYTFSFKVKSVEATQSLCFVLLVQSWDASGVSWKNSGEVVVNATATSSDWTEVSMTYLVPENHANVQLRIQERWSTGYYVDDIAIYYEKANMVEKADIAYQDGFDDGTDTYTYVQGTGSHIVEMQGENKVVKITSDTSSWYTLGTTTAGIPVKSGETYTFSFKVKSVAATQPLCFVLFVQSWDASGVSWKNSGEVVVNATATSSDWTEVSMTYLVPENHANVQLRIQERWSTAYYVDDIKIYYPTTVVATTYTEGIGACVENDVAAEADNVLSMKEYTEVKQSVTLPVGTYNYSFAVKSVDTGSDFAFGIKAGNTKQEIATTSEWQTVTGTVELTADATSFGFYRTGKGEVLIDDVVLTSVSAAVTDHTPDLPSDYIPEGVTNLIDGDFTDGTYKGFGFSDDSYVTAADGRAKIQFNNNNVYVQTNSFTATKGHTYVLSYYIWLDNANGIGINMAQVNVGAGGPTGANEWKDLLWSSANQEGGFTATLDGAPLSGEITADTEGWKEVKVTWTAQENGNFALILLRNYWGGTGDVYLDDVALYDTTPGEVVRLNYYDLGSDNEGYLVTSDTDETVTITDSEGNKTTVEAGGYKVLNEAGEYIIKRDDIEEKIVLYKRGDANADYDGEVTAKDLIATKKKVEKQVIDSASTRAADINADGMLDSNDDAFLRYIIVNDYDIVNTTKGVSSLGQGVMPIIGYNGPSNVDTLKNLSSLGMNYVVVNETDISGNAALAQKILAAAESNKMKVFLNNDKAVNPDGGSAVAKVDDLASYNQDYDNYSSFAGYYVADGVYYKRQYTSDSGKYFANNGIAEYAGVLTTVANYVNVNSYFNLLPMNSEELAYSFSGSEDTVSVTYDNYKAYALAANIAGSDFLSNATVMEDGLENFYKNLAWMRAISQDNTVEKPFYATVELDESNTANMYLEANAALAFGAKGIQYDTVANASTGVSNINHFIRKVDYILMDADSKGVMTTVDTIKDYVDRGLIENYGAVTGVTGSNALVGCFDYFGKDTYLVVNTGDTANTYTLNFNKALNGTVITFAGIVNNLSAANTYQVEVGAGESVLVVLDTVSNTQDVSGGETEGAVVSTNMQDTIVTANAIANSVQGYYADGNKTSYVVENQNMKLTHGLATGNTRLTSIQNVQGGTYLTSDGNTFDAVINVNGTEAYSSASTNDIWANTTQMGYYYYETRLQQMNFGASISNMYLEKTYHTYADKLYQEFRVIATNDATESQVRQLGFRAYIPKSTVAKIQLSDGTSLYENAESIPNGGISNLQYAGFDIDGVGVIGFIVAGQSNTHLHVNHDANGYYISQYVKNLTFTDFTAEEIANWSNNSMTEPTGYITFGNRVYTDATHSFDGLVQANKEEQNPLTAENITVDESVSGAEFVGYDYLTGAYRFNINGSGYSAANSNKDNANYFEHIQIENAPDNRVIYLDVHTVEGGGTEGAALVDSNGTQIPVPMQVSKNFSGDNVTEFYNNDTLYGATYMPLCIKEGEGYDFTVINAYWNWGDEFPIKQLSSIEYYTSYYHMSTGTVETTCIAPYYGANNNDGFFEGISYFLPDFRGMSNAALAGDNIQNNSVGVVYGPSNGSSIGTYTSSDIYSTGLTYSDMDYSYVSDDGAFKYTMRHVEMPQEDESRTYYTIDFEILKDTTLTQEDFEIIGFDGKNGIYKTAQYVDANGTSQTLDLWKEGINLPLIGQVGTGFQNTGYYKLQKGTSYFAFYDMHLLSEDYPETGNFGLIVKDHSDNISLAFANQTHTPEYWHRTKINYGYLTLAADTAFSVGDKFSVDLILLPFGSVGDTNCDSVVEVYNDSAVNAIKTQAEVGTVIADTWVPTVKADNNIAEFTLTGGVNANTSDDSVNYAVKVTGFDALIVPLVQQKVDGKWVTYEYATELGYDGYSVAYEDDGTYSYSFVFKQTSAGNTFRVLPSKNVKVSYYVDGAVAKTLQTKTGETIVKPDAKTLGIFGHKIEGYYTDAAFVKKFDFTQTLSDDVNIYVKLSDYIYVDADMVSMMSQVNVTSSGVTTDDTHGDVYQVSSAGGMNILLRKSGLNLKVGESQTIKMVIKSENLDHVQLKLAGTYLTAEGTQATAIIPEDAAEAINYTATSYVKWPTDGSYVELEFQLNSTTLGNVAVRKFLEITDLVILTNPDTNVETQSMSIASIKQELADTHTVTYKLGDTELATQTVAYDKQIGEIPTTAIETHSAMMGYQVLGYYMDAACTVPYDFGNWIIKDTTVYVKKGDTFYISAAALETFGKSDAVSTLMLQEDGSTRITGTGDTYVYKEGLANINVENQTLEMRVKTKNVDGISMYCHGTYTKDGTEGSTPWFTGDFWAHFVDTGEVDSEGYSIYTLDFSNIQGASWKTLTGFRIGSYNTSELTLDVKEIKVINQ